MIYVTHDQVEAMTLGDRIVVLHDGIIEQVGSPMELYNNPANKFVAGFIGSPQMNFIDAAALGRSDAKTIGIRPEHIQPNKKSGDVKGRVSHVEHLGGDTNLYPGNGKCRTDFDPVVRRTPVRDRCDIVCQIRRRSGLPVR